MNIEWETGFCEYDIVDENSNKVTILHWSCIASEAGESVRSVGTVNTADQNRVYTLQALSNVPNHVFTEWVHQALGDDGVASTESIVTNLLNEKLNPTSGGLVPSA